MGDLGRISPGPVECFWRLRSFQGVSDLLAYLGAGHSQGPVLVGALPNQGFADGYGGSEGRVLNLAQGFLKVVRPVPAGTLSVGAGFQLGVPRKYLRCLPSDERRRSPPSLNISGSDVMDRNKSRCPSGCRWRDRTGHIRCCRCSRKGRSAGSGPFPSSISTGGPIGNSGPPPLPRPVPP